MSGRHRRAAEGSHCARDGQYARGTSYLRVQSLPQPYGGHCRGWRGLHRVNRDKRVSGVSVDGFILMRLYYRAKMETFVPYHHLFSNTCRTLYISRNSLRASRIALARNKFNTRINQITLIQINVSEPMENGKFKLED